MKNRSTIGNKRPRIDPSEDNIDQKQSGSASSATDSGNSVSIGGGSKKGSSNWDLLKQKLTVNSLNSSSAKTTASVVLSAPAESGARSAKKKRRIDLKKAVSIAERKDPIPASESIEEEIAKSESFVSKSRYVGLDCEMVGIGASGKQSALARCCLIDFDGNVIFDEYVKPPGFVTDFRTKYSGIRKKDISGDHVISLQEVRRKACCVPINRRMLHICTLFSVSVSSPRCGTIERKSTSRTRSEERFGRVDAQASSLYDPRHCTLRAIPEGACSQHYVPQCCSAMHYA
jgi:hypothetical protein